MRVAPLAKEEPLPTVAEMRARARDQLKSEKQESFERRFRARQLLFGKARGHMKNLKHRDRMFVLGVMKDTYQLYLQEFVTGKSRYRVGPSWSRLRRRRNFQKPIPFRAWRKQWWCSQKNRYTRFDIPLQFKKRMEDLRYGDKK